MNADAPFALPGSAKPAAVVHLPDLTPERLGSEVGERAPARLERRIGGGVVERAVEPDRRVQDAGRGLVPPIGETAPAQVDPGEAERALRVATGHAHEVVVDAQRLRVRRRRSVATSAGAVAARAHRAPCGARCAAGTRCRAGASTSRELGGAERFEIAVVDVDVGERLRDRVEHRDLHVGESGLGRDRGGDAPRHRQDLLRVGRGVVRLGTRPLIVRRLLRVVRRSEVSRQVCQPGGGVPSTAGYFRGRDGITRRQSGHRHRGRARHRSGGSAPARGRGRARRRQRLRRLAGRRGRRSRRRRKSSPRRSAPRAATPSPTPATSPSGRRDSVWSRSRSTSSGASTSW